MIKDEALGTIQGIYFSIGVDSIRTQMIKVADWIKEQPEVVQCDNCKHAVHDGEGYLCVELDKYVDDDFYCKYGERR